jgi:hypothetical protein
VFNCVGVADRTVLGFHEDSIFIEGNRNCVVGKRMFDEGYRAAKY